MPKAITVALDKLEAGDWEAAHTIAQDESGALAAWLHAHLHRAEGDNANAAYWYRQAGRAPFTGSLEEERRALRDDATG
ncbi:hypothetical protein [Oceaniovalibus sp. ACAM 378]|uniref:hypothetical protein n=1 Tax=Oceaniovalibus sp. ACAM 378 TaxID=2599923 RepID=UPI0011D62A2C|nr:hypothetical protein [Oceaniovalibus sp. ACAM 378]TYB91038.1 hypothetical protein FQ320_00580 [Oceaniovalibus sp. ACAM 378]